MKIECSFRGHCSFVRVVRPINRSAEAEVQRKELPANKKQHRFLRPGKTCQRPVQCVIDWTRFSNAHSYTATPDRLPPKHTHAHLAASSELTGLRA